MFSSEERLDHLLQPHHYFDAEHYATELRAMFLPSWQFAVTHSEIADAGDYVTLDVAGIPAIIRNFGDTVAAFRNVCPHRHSMLRCEPRGNMDTLRCQYHGWEFQPDGSTAKIPEPRGFRPWDRENSHLQTLRLERIADLYFITTDASLPPLRKWLPDVVVGEIESAFATPTWRKRRTWEFDVPCNWKIPVENTLEGYHIGEVHPQWYGGGLPSAENSRHQLHPQWTSLTYPHEFATDRGQAWLSRRLGNHPRLDYRHYQIHPNLTLGLNDVFGYLSQCVPTSPTTSRCRIRTYSLHGRCKTPIDWVARTISHRWGESMFTKIINQDRTIYGPQQRGMQSSPHRGVIGIREERVHYFQHFVQTRCGIEPSPSKSPPTPPSVSTSESPPASHRATDPPPIAQSNGL